MNLIIHTSENKKTYIFVSPSYFDYMENKKVILEEKTWNTTLFYLGTLTTTFRLYDADSFNQLKQVLYANVN